MRQASTNNCEARSIFHNRGSAEEPAQICDRLLVASAFANALMPTGAAAVGGGPYKVLGTGRRLLEAAAL
jgi:hypothetical protein